MVRLLKSKFKKYYVTGYKSGLGKHIFETLENTSPFEELSFANMKENEGEYNILILCGFNRIHPKEIISYDVFDRNVNRIQYKGGSIDHVIYISTIDVYPKSRDIIFHEDYLFRNTDFYSIYQYQKILSEQRLLNLGHQKITVLRLPALVGKNCIPNSITKVVNGENCNLSGSSSFYALTYDAVLDTLTQCVESLAFGIYNCTPTQKFTLHQLAEECQKNINFGTFTYYTPNIDSSKISKKINFDYKSPFDILLS